MELGTAGKNNEFSSPGDVSYGRCGLKCAAELLKTCVVRVNCWELRLRLLWMGDGGGRRRLLWMGGVCVCVCDCVCV